MTTDRPNIVPWPPIIFALTLAVGFALIWLIPVRPPLFYRLLLGAIGLPMVLGGLAIIWWAAATLWKARTTVMPHQPADALVTDGPFRHSRNPIYGAEVMILIGLAALFSTPWFALLVPVFMVLVRRFGIEREENHLAQRFAADWPDYARKVRRWL